LEYFTNVTQYCLNFR